MLNHDGDTVGDNMGRVSDKLILVNGKSRDTLTKHEYRDFEIRTKITVPKIVLKQWKLIRKHNLDGKYLYKCDTNSFKITYQWLTLELQQYNIGDKENILQKLKYWFDGIMMNYDIRNITVYYLGSNLTMTREYEYMVNIN